MHTKIVNHGLSTGELMEFPGATLLNLGAERITIGEKAEGTFQIARADGNSFTINIERTIPLHDK